MKSIPDSKLIEEKRRALVQAYKQTFATIQGKAVLADLMDRYGFDEFGIERSAVVNGSDQQNLFLVEGMKEPVRRILRQLATVDREQKPKPETAQTP